MSTPKASSKPTIPETNRKHFEGLYSSLLCHLDESLTIFEIILPNLQNGYAAEELEEKINQLKELLRQVDLAPYNPQNVIEIKCSKSKSSEKSEKSEQEKPNHYENEGSVEDLFTIFGTEKVKDADPIFGGTAGLISPIKTDNQNNSGSKKNIDIDSISNTSMRVDFLREKETKKDLDFSGMFTPKIPKIPKLSKSESSKSEASKNLSDPKKKARKNYKTYTHEQKLFGKYLIN